MSQKFRIFHKTAIMDFFPLKECLMATAKHNKSKQDK